MPEHKQCPSCGHDLIIKYTPTPEYYDLTQSGFNLLDENYMSSVEVICPYNEGDEDHLPDDPNWVKDVILEFHRQVLGGRQ